MGYTIVGIKRKQLRKERWPEDVLKSNESNFISDPWKLILLKNEALRMKLAKESNGFSTYIIFGLKEQQSVNIAK
jgi:hypothetical protein